MKYALFTHVGQSFETLAGDWSDDDLRHMIDYCTKLNADLEASGELIASEGFNGAHKASTVTARSDGSALASPGLDTDQSVIAFWLVEVATYERAAEIAAAISATPGPGRKPVNQPVQLHPCGTAPSV